MIIAETEYPTEIINVKTGKQVPTPVEASLKSHHTLDQILCILLPVLFGEVDNNAAVQKMLTFPTNRH
ncbi:MAG: hypothetical protein GW947_00430 [Candidatus Pacebacteria bacterium]|nr:hypothetical protein [Candidatus Paceibacterota bacterium]PIR61194.1 MAG: hypothetical protein COU68_00745 [Candidatus Pacebacteria bacterium CG10_big_fil_rev_8_21_14_0_10_45_6]